MDMPDNPFVTFLEDVEKEELNPFISFAQSQEKPIENTETEEEPLSEIPKQLGKGAVSGALGSYGDILDLFGLQSKKTLPGEEAKRQREHKILGNLEKPGHIPSIGELQELSDDDVLPRYSRLPSSAEIGKITEDIGGPGKPKGPKGRVSERIGKFAGGGLATGTPGLKAPIAAGLAGQAAEEMGAPAWVQAALEMGSFLKFSNPKVPLTTKSPQIKEQIKKLEKLGFSEEDITLAKNALEDRGWLKKLSRFGGAEEKAFHQSAANTEQNFNKIIESAFPGLEEGGTNALKNASGKLFDSLDDLAKGVIIENPETFINNAGKAINSLDRTLAQIPQKQQVIDLLREAMKSSFHETPADFYTNFYKDLNAIGHWGNAKQREHVFTTVKDAIKNTFRDQGPEGKKLANALEEANKSWIKYLQAEDVTNLMKKAVGEEGMNFSKMTKLLENPDNFSTFSKALGKEQAQNLRLISKTGQNIKDLKKVMEGGDVKKFLGEGKLYLIAKSALSMEFKQLATLIGSEVAGKVASKMITDPKYQNLTRKMLKAVDEEKWGFLRVLSNSLEKRIEKDFPESKNKITPLKPESQ